MVVHLYKGLAVEGPWFPRPVTLVVTEIDKTAEHSVKGAWVTYTMFPLQYLADRPDVGVLACPRQGVWGVACEDECLPGAQFGLVSSGGLPIRDVSIVGCV